MTEMTGMTRVFNKHSWVMEVTGMTGMMGAFHKHPWPTKRIGFFAQRSWVFLSRKN